MNYLSYVELVYLLINFFNTPVRPRQLIHANIHRIIENTQMKKIAMNIYCNIFLLIICSIIQIIYIFIHFSTF
jgi:hypothetical protein